MPAITGRGRVRQYSQHPATPDHGDNEEATEPSSAGNGHAEAVRMACVFQANKFGVAYFEPATRELSVLQTHDEGSGPFAHQMLQLAKLQASPQIIYTSSQADDAFLTKLRQPVSLSGQTQPDSAAQLDVRLEKSMLFRPEQAWRCLQNLHIRGMPADLQGNDRLHLLNTMINLSAMQQVCAAGALIAILHRDGLLDAGFDDGCEPGSADSLSIMTVNSLAEISLDGFLMVDKASLDALQIFQEERHPSAMGVGNSKEGFSVFGMLNKCVTPMGKRLLRLWFLRPILNLENLHDRQDTIDYLMHAPDMLKSLRDTLKKVKDVPKLMQRLQATQGLLDIHDFSLLLDSLSSLLLLRDMLAGTAAAARCPSRGQHPQHAQHAYRAPNGLDYFGSAYNESAFDEAARHRSSAVPLAASDPLLPGSRFAASDQIGYPGGSTSYTLGRPESPAPSFLQQPSLSPSGLSSGQPFTYSQQRQSRQPHHHQPQQRSYHLNQQQHAYYDQPNEPHQADEDMPSTPSIITKALTCISEELLTCRSLVAEIIDFDQAADGMMVAYGVCDPLDELKHTYHGLPDFLTRVVEDELNRIPRELGHRLSSQLWSIIYIPQVGFVMRLEGQRLTAELEEFLPDFEFAFEGTAEESCGFYYYTDRTRQLNERFGDLLHKIQDLEGSITTELIRRIAAFGPHMNRAVAVAAELDCLISLATCAREFNYTKPKLTHDNILHIKQGRHMLTEMMVEGCYVPNDTDMAEDSNRVQVITGPNFSGKSCYAKQVGLIVFLAHIGSFVPAAEATIGLTDRIFTRIASQETLSVPQSTFMIDLSQMSTMLRHATGRSLCIIDEFGKGTLTTDGVGLLCATLRHFSGALQPPKVLACTHFSEVLEEENLPRCRQLTFLTMNVLADPLKSGAEQDKVVFLYRIVPGYAAPSFGVHCAQLAGLKPDILQRAVQVIEDQQAGKLINAIHNTARDARFRNMTARLARVNLRDQAALHAFLHEVAHEDDPQYSTEQNQGSQPAWRQPADAVTS